MDELLRSQPLDQRSVASVKTSTQCRRGRREFRSAPRSHAAVLPSPAELPILRIS